ncbi:MoaD/ThiS family protein [Botrimarina hoheduenensis]|uniref:Molybdopterin synthase sulfur carrier subunit n=1 Tax=Botrimarina hoheduenensis TaxID=2528000 RepID=A0A5C5VS48_9BACT|nr:MoaD/ThiS family protein [Botrimarina hoheduenensis]TWT41424.1 ThiS family protein [Botrimarina hoheduenensis]
MVVQVLLFGPQARLVGSPSLPVEILEDRITAARVLATLAESVPQLAASLPASRLAVNHEFAESHTPIKPGDEVALIGMVSGG